ncbi:hypothetical protein L2E82_21161 [Cichorium intybus]|uniref:Uncharacterized protein n=1 Tax=Cichorium intybus TaxID=13427 RepID=A0ACB9DWA6_CICIN|nr:hypothetical protein L2E82_21161 [Cichorium intybus]
MRVLMELGWFDFGSSMAEYASSEMVISPEENLVGERECYRRRDGGGEGCIVESIVIGLGSHRRRSRMVLGYFGVGPGSLHGSWTRGIRQTQY